MGENILSRCANDVTRLAIHAFLDVDDSYLRFAGSHMARFASWCEREEVYVCWKALWKASTVILAACSSGRNVGLSRFFRSLIESCRAWLLPEGRSAQRYSAPRLEWISQSLRVLCWLEEFTLETRGNSLQKQLALRRSKYLPESALGSEMADSILMRSRPLLSGSPDSSWDLSSKRHQMVCSLWLLH